MKVIHYAETEKCLTSYSRFYNYSLKKIKDSKGRLYIPKTEGAIKGSELKTAMALVHILSRYCYQSQLIGVFTGQTIIESCLPALSNKTGYSKRTISRHIVKLIKAGIITNKINKPARPINGRYQHQLFELVINPKLVVYKEKLNREVCENEAKEANLDLLENQLVESGAMTERPQLQPKKLKEINSISGVHDVHNLNANAKKEAKASGTPESNTQRAAFLSFCAQLALLLWQFSRSRLYAHLPYIADKQREHAVTFFHEILTAEKTEKRAKAAFNECMAALEYRAKWNDKKPERAKKIKMPCEYFTADGFLKSYSIYIQNKAKFGRETPNFEHSISSIERRIVNEYLREPNLKKYMATVKRLSKLDAAPGAVQRFNQLIINQNS